jgi:hypothetical protein
MFTPASASFRPNLAASPGLVCALDLQGRTLGELQARARQGGADGGLVAGAEQDGRALSAHHTGELKVAAERHFPILG